MSTISLAQLLSTCMDASYQGCKSIRNFQKKQGDAAVKGTLKETNEIRSVVTQADIDAQNVILKGLRNTWGSTTLRIIGEEDEQQDDDGTTPALLRKDLLKDIKDEELNLDDLSIFVDPLDGTREFVEGRLENVACLIGIAKNNRAIAGVVGLPFPKNDDILIHYSIGDHGLNGIWPSKKPSQEIDDDSITIYTGDSNNPILLNATKCAMSLSSNTKHEIIGGTASKLIQVATQSKDSMAVLHFKTELWDTCPLESLLHSKQGKITDLFGAKLVYDSNRNFGNVFGVVASSAGCSRLHDELCESMRKDHQSVHAIFKGYLGDEIPPLPQAMDIARDLDGIPLSTSYIQALFSTDNKLKGYSIPEKDAWRGMMSTGMSITCCYLLIYLS